MMNTDHSLDVWAEDSDKAVENIIRQYDGNVMPVPNIDYEPHVLISKVRKHYLEYIIKSLSVNYENNQRLMNKNIYLPSAIWRCAKNIEMAAAQSCMVVDIYRKNIVTLIKDLNEDTKKGRLNKKLFECLHWPPQNEKKVQTTFAKSKDCSCQCTCNSRKRRKKSISPKTERKSKISPLEIKTQNVVNTDDQYKIPVIVNNNIGTPQMNKIFNTSHPMHQINSNEAKSVRIEPQDSDELMQQMEKMFRTDDTNDDDLFEGTLFDSIFDPTVYDENGKISQTDDNFIVTQKYSQDTNQQQNPIQAKSLDERLASLAGILINNNNNNDNNTRQAKEIPKKTKISTSKWLCEEYFLKQQLYEILDQIRDSNRNKLARIKDLFIDLFGDDSDDEGVLSPLEETPEFITSCKERIAPWVVKLLTPYYIKGRIKGKALFKSLAKHLIRLIYQCSRYPKEYEVHSFISDFLQSHKMIRCEADFKQFRIENI